MLPFAAKMRSPRTDEFNMIAVYEQTDGKILRGLRTWLAFRMWSEKRGGGKHDLGRRDQNAGYSRTSGTDPRSLNVCAHGRCEAARVAPGGQPFLCRNGRCEDGFRVQPEGARRARLEGIAEHVRHRAISQRDVLA